MGPGSTAGRPWTCQEAEATPAWGRGADALLHHSREEVGFEPGQKAVLRIQSLSVRAKPSQGLLPAVPMPCV